MTISANGRASRRLLGKICILLATAAAVWVVARVTLSISARPKPEAGPLPGVPVLQVAEGLRTVVQRGDRVTLRASAAVVKLRRPRALGPFRIGFMRSVEARDVTIETFDAPRQDARSVASWDCLGEAIAALAPKTPDAIMHVEAENVRLIRHEAHNQVLSLRASSCESTTRHSRFVCRHGTARSERGEIRFLEAVCDRAACRLDGIPWP
jgi:hypothetical protein